MKIIIKKVTLFVFNKNLQKKKKVNLYKSMSLMQDINLKFTPLQILKRKILNHYKTVLKII